MARAKDNRGYASAAARVGSAYTAANRALAGRGPRPADENLSRLLRGALGRAGKAYGQLASAARANRRTRFASVRRAVSRAEADLAGALRAMRAAGYEVRRVGAGGTLVVFKAPKQQEQQQQQQQQQDTSGGPTPTATAQPTAVPTQQATVVPTQAPTQQPTPAPTEVQGGN